RTYFFFSSRRRHTRFSRDWSSDVCSSDLIRLVASCNLPTEWGIFTLHGFEEAATGREHVALTMGDLADGAPVLARLHSECLTGRSEERRVGKERRPRRRWDVVIGTNRTGS